MLNTSSQCRQRCYEHEEKIAHELRQKTANQTIPAINDELGLKITDSLKINSCFQHFYQSLYTSDLSTIPTAMEDFLSPLHVPCVDPNMADTLEKDLSTLEITSAVRSMQSSKSPGPDGYPTEFFKKFSNQLAPLHLSVFEESLSFKTLPPTMCQAVISVILKKRKNPLECN